jgi:uncharacterized protein
MKYLVVLAVVLVVLWFLRNNRRADAAQGSRSSDGVAAQPEDMVQCPTCSVRLPRTDALPGPDGQLYCCAEHRPRDRA